MIVADHICYVRRR